MKFHGRSRSDVGRGGEPAHYCIQCEVEVFGILFIREQVADMNSFLLLFTDKKEKKIFLIYKDVQMGAVAKSYMRKVFLIANI
jgi:hypothetical protein